jgi:type I restriction enzyme S subunit
VSEQCNLVLKRSELKVNDILFSIAGTLGRTAIVKEKDIPANTNQALSIIRLKTGVNLDFINHSLNTIFIEKYIFKMVSVGAQPNLNLQQVGNIKIGIPIISEQTKIANFLSDIDTKIEVLTGTISKAQTFKKGLLQQMFV